MGSDLSAPRFCLKLDDERRREGLATMEGGYAAIHALGGIVRGETRVSTDPDSVREPPAGGGEIARESAPLRPHSRPSSRSGPVKSTIIQPRRVVCLTGFLALISLVIFAINKLAELVKELASNELFLSRLSLFFSERANRTGGVEFPLSVD